MLQATKRICKSFSALYLITILGACGGSPTASDFLTALAPANVAMGGGVTVVATPVRTQPLVRSWECTMTHPPGMTPVQVLVQVADGIVHEAKRQGCTAQALPVVPSPDAPIATWTANNHQGRLTAVLASSTRTTCDITLTADETP